LAFSPEGRILIAGVHDKTLKIWDWEKAQHLRTIDRFGNVPNALAFADGGKTVITAYSAFGDRFVSVIQHWDCDSGLEKKKIELVGGGANRNVTPTGDVLITVAGFPNKVAKAWRLDTGKYVALEGHTSYVHSGAVSRDGKLAGTAESDFTLRLWNLPSGKQRWSVRGDFATSPYLTFSPDGKTLASKGGSPLPSIWLWDVATGKEKTNIPNAGGLNYPFLFSPDGKRIAFGYNGQEFALWDVEKAKTIKVISFAKKGERSKIMSMAFSPDSRTIAVGGSIDRQGMIRLYDIE